MPGWILGKHLKLICREVQDLVEGRLFNEDGEEYMGLIISLPPQHGKSNAITETLPSWYLGKFPERRVIEVSYGDDLAQTFGRRNKHKIDEYGYELFGIKLSKSTRSETEFEIEGHKGSMISRGIMAGITGRAGDCFPKGTMISTEIGEIEISELVAMINPPLVLSYDFTYDKIVLKEIIARRVKYANKFTTIKTVCGDEITSTSNHCYYTKERGFQQASILRRGDTFISIRDNGMSVVQGEEEKREQNMQTMLSSNKACKGNNKVQLLWERIRATTLRIRKKIKTWADRFLLFSRMYIKRLQKENVNKAMPCMWRNNTNKREQILFKKMQGENKSTQICQDKMSYMQQGISTQIQQDNILLKNMCRQGTFRKNERGKQFTLQGWNELCKTVQRVKTFNKRKRQLQMCNMWHPGNNNNQDEFNYTSYRRKPCKKYSRKFNNTMYAMPRYTPSFSTDAIQDIEHYSSRENKVYDIQVEETHNFFANGILVHNCVIIDDPVKNRQEAESQTYRDRVWDEWQNSIKTRLSAKGKVIVIQTRWHESDLAGLLSKNYPKRFKYINIPCEAEENDILGRQPGESLFPEIGKDDKWLKQFKQDYIDDPTEGGLRAWNALFQGHPMSEEGIMLKKQWWRYYDVSQPIQFDMTMQSWDMAFKDEPGKNTKNSKQKGSDRVAGQVWSVKDVNVYLRDLVCKRMSFVETVKAVEDMTKKWPDAALKLIEDKANGPAVMSLLRTKIGGMVPVDPKGSKESAGGGSKVARASAVSPILEAGNVYLPCHGWNPDGTPILDKEIRDFIEECATFPLADYDDQVDVFTQLLRRFIYVILPQIELDKKSVSKADAFDRDLDVDDREGGYYD